MNPQSLRKFAIDLLDDENGINDQAWDQLSDLLNINRDDDIVDAVKAQDGRWYLTSEKANELRKRS